MNELRMIENELVPVYETSTGEKVVYGSELHKVLGAKSKFADWVKNRLNDCDAVENVDYEASKILEASGQTKIEYILKLDTAKEMAMLQRNEKGKQVRRYFINVEKKYNEIKRMKFEEQDIFTQVFGKRRGEEEIFANWGGTVLLPPPKKTWYERNQNNIKTICKMYDWNRKFLYHKILTELGTRYDLNEAKRIYARENGFLPYYATDIIEYFPQLQKTANKYIDYLLEG
ncbi:MAG: antA/AntB antirepressor family protein [Lachnospiraceae bacterium]|nr:antA/AntB antirepressor family protein [Lachnospiraceae bacterium]